MKRLLLSAAIVSVLTFSTGCEMVDSQTLQKSREFFPNAVLYKFQPSLLWIQTGVNNVSAKFLEETFLAMTKKESFGQLISGMDMAGYRFLALGFEHYIVIWERQTSRYWVLDATGAQQWFQSVYGTVPTKLNIRVVR